MNVGTAGAGSSTHIAGIYFQNEVGAKLAFIPYKGTPKEVIARLNAAVVAALKVN